jgi:hypothetical protein
MQSRIQRRQPRNVRVRVRTALLNGLTVVCKKTKSRENGGKQMVSVGRRVVAVKKKGDYPFCFITTGRYPESNRDWGCADASEAAQAFIAFVGHDLAWDAVVRAFRGGPYDKG